jgi:hypothetical protein
MVYITLTKLLNGSVLFCGDVLARRPGFLIFINLISSTGTRYFTKSFLQCIHQTGRCYMLCTTRAYHSTSVQFLCCFCRLVSPAITACHYHSPRYLPVTLYLICSSSTLLFLVMSFCRRCRSREVQERDVESNGAQQRSSCQWFWSDGTYCVLQAMAKLTLIMAYFYVCDR